MFDSLKNLDTSLQIMLLLALLSFAPILLLTFTSFLRITIILVLIRQAIDLKSALPAIVIMSMALILTFYAMHPTFVKMYEEAKVPYATGESITVVLEKGLDPLKNFMLKQTSQKDIEFFSAFCEEDVPDLPEDIKLKQLLPAFVISEIRTAFNIGFALFIPFILVDIIIANILLAIGLFMLPPMGISLPVKILLFLAVDGWNLVFTGLITSFN